MNYNKYVVDMSVIMIQFKNTLQQYDIWYPKNVQDAEEQLQALGLPAKSENVINIGNTGGVTTLSQIKQVKTAIRVFGGIMIHMFEVDCV